VANTVLCIASNAAMRLRCKIAQKGNLPKIGVPFIISATAEASDFKFGMQLRFARAYHEHHTKV